MNIFKIIPIYTIINCILIILTIYDFFEHGIAYLFFGITGIFISILGIVASLLFMLKKEIGRVLLIDFSICYILYYLILFVLNEDIFNIIILFILISFIIISILLSRPSVYKITTSNWKNNTFDDSSRKKSIYFKISPISLSILILFLIIPIIIWLIDWENITGIIKKPNGIGVEYYQGKDSTGFDLTVNGGFVYDDRDMLSIKLTSIESTITINSREDKFIKLRLLNIDEKNSTVEVNGKKIKYEENFNSKKINIEALKRGEDVLSGKFLIQDKGKIINLKLLKDNTYKISIKNYDTNKREKIIFYAISDTHSVYTLLLEEIKKIIKDESSFLIFNGDMVNNGFDTEYLIFANFIENMPKQVFTTIGNHDVWSGGKIYYVKYFGPTYYYFLYNDIVFIFMDTSTGYIGSTQFSWLKSILEQYKTKTILVFSHMSPIDTYKGYFDRSSKISPELLHNIHSKAESDYLVEILKQYNVRYFIAGHSHIHAKTKIGNTVFVTGGVMGGSVTDDRSTYSYLRFEIEGDNINFRPIIVKDTKLMKKEALAQRITIARIFLTPMVISKSVCFAMTLLYLVILSIGVYFIRKYYLVYST